MAALPLGTQERAEGLVVSSMIVSAVWVRVCAWQ
jgi:hypothetical protein